MSQLVVFNLGVEEYALPITQVQEIIRFTEPRSVAAEAPWMTGVISLRGKIVPVCDLAARIGIEHERVEHAKIVIVETGDGTAGVIVDDVREVLAVDDAELDVVPGGGADFIAAIAKVDDRLVVLLDPEALFAGLELEAAA